MATKSKAKQTPKKAKKPKRQTQKAGMRSMLQPVSEGSPGSKAQAKGDSIDRLSGEVMELEYIPIERLYPNPFQPRKSFDEDGLRELAASIAKNGFFGNLLVRGKKGKRGQFELAFGERRLRAAGQAGLTSLPCEVRKDLSDQQMAEFAMVENIQREDLNPAEEIEALSQLKSITGLSMQNLATKIGKSKTWVVERLRVGKYLEILEAVREGLPWTSGTELARIDDGETRLFLLDLVKEGKLTREDLLAFNAGEKTLDDFKAGNDTGSGKNKKEKKRPSIKTSLRRLETAIVDMSHTELKAKEQEEARQALQKVIQDAQALLAAWDG